MIAKGKISNRPLGFESLEERRMLALQVDFGATSVIEGELLSSPTVTRTSGDFSQPLTVTLSLDESNTAVPSRINVPPTVVIEANNASASFNLFAHPDRVVDDLATVTLNASASGFPDAIASIDIVNRDLVQLRPGAANDTISLRPASFGLYDTSGTSPADWSTAEIDLSLIDATDQRVAMTLRNYPKTLSLFLPR